MQKQHESRSVLRGGWPLRRFPGTAVRVGDVERGALIKAAVPIKVPGVDPVLPVCCVLLGAAVLHIKLP